MKSIEFRFGYVIDLEIKSLIQSFSELSFQISFMVSTATMIMADSVIFQRFNEWIDIDYSMNIKEELERLLFCLALSECIL